MEYTRDQLAELLRVPKKSISAWGAPSKKAIIIGSNDMIDDSIDKNRKFINKKLREISMTPEEKAIVIKPTPTMRKKPTGKKKIVPKKEKMVPTKNHDSSNKEPSKVAKGEKPLSPDVEYINEFEKRKNELTIERLEQEVRNKRADAERKEGDYISTKETIEAVTRWSIEKDKYLLQQLEIEIKYICDREGVPADRAARYKKKLPLIINAASSRASDKLTKMI